MIKKLEKIRILFLGELISSHAQSWIDLLKPEREQFDILGFGVPGSPYPQSDAFPMFMKNLNLINSNKIPLLVQQKLLAYVLESYRPHIIHSFAAFPTAELYTSVIKRHKGNAKWISQVRGGPDVYMNCHKEKKREILKDMFVNCDLVIADNEINYHIAEDLGAPKNKHWTYGIAPGSGGLDLADFSDAMLPSKSKRQVIWPKAYEGYESKGLSVLEAIKIAWPKIEGTKFIFTAVNYDLLDRLPFMPKEIMAHVDVKYRIPRKDMLSLMKQSRVVMAPSLLEGIPNSLYEAMAAQCVPLYSPLETYQHKFKDQENVIYARNLYPDEIAAALIKAVNDDTLADKIATNNVSLVSKIANRKNLSKSLIELYKNLAN